MGPANCKSLCQPNHDTLGYDPLVIKQFTEHQRETFFNNLQPYFADGIKSLELSNSLKQILDQKNQTVDEDAKIWKYSGNLEEISKQFGPAYLWNTTFKNQNDKKKSLQQDQKSILKQKQGLLSCKLKILFSDKNDPTKIISYFHSQVYKGYARDIKATVIHDNGTIFKGQLINSSANGYGKFENRSLKYCYEGNWSQDYPHSPIQNAKQSIRISEEDEQAQKYVGQFRYGKRQGNGTLTSPQTKKHPKFEYKGEFRAGKFHGNGQLKTYQSLPQSQTKTQCVYNGEFKMGMKQGKGKWEGFEQQYDGDWEKNCKHGQGLFIYHRSSTKYAGNFANDQFNGQGKVFDRDGKQIIQGLWAKGKCILKT